MTISFRAIDVSLEDNQAAASDSQWQIVARQSSLGTFEGTEYRMVIVTPPTGMEFADLAMPLPIYLDLGAAGGSVAQTVQREISKRLKKVHAPRNVLPNEGLAVNWSIGSISFVSSAGGANAMCEALARFVATIGANCVAPKGAMLTQPREGGYDHQLWIALASDGLRTESEISNSISDLLSRTGMMAPVPQSVRMRILTGLVLSDAVSNRIGEVHVTRAALVHALADPCLHTTVEAELALATSEVGSAHRMLELAPTVVTPRGEANWQGELNGYLDEMHAKYPVYWQRLQM